MISSSISRDVASSVVLSFAMLLLLNVSSVAAASRPSRAAASKGHIHIQHQNRVTATNAEIFAAFVQPLSISSSPASIVSPAAVAVPAAKANIKRIFFQNNCSCSENNKSPYPLVALSYKPVQSADFYNIGYWSVVGCDAKYLVATTEGVMGIYAEMSDGSWVWDGNKPLTVYVPSENRCAGRKRFVQYDLPLDWQDHTVHLNC